MRFWGIATVLLVGLALSASAQTSQSPKGKATQTPAPPADDNSKQIEFDTTDEARLVGTFYRGLKGPESPCVLLIHRFKSDRTKSGWDTLARELQKAGYAVLSFDFRGHGASLRVREKFWNYEHNKLGLRGGSSLRGKGQITVADFRPSYWPVLLNDIAAARHFLEQMNDANQCNAGTIIVIGAEDGASLGICWMANEVDRRPVPSGTSIFNVGPVAKMPGDDLAAGIWLGPVTRSPASGTSFRTSEWIGRASSLRANTPMYFIFGKQDQASAAAVPSMLAAIRRNPENIKNKHAYDRDEVLNTRLPGQDLIGPTATTLGVNEKIIKYLDQLTTNFRKNVVWKEMKPSMPALFPLASFGYNPPG